MLKSLYLFSSENQARIRAISPSKKDRCRTNRSTMTAAAATTVTTVARVLRVLRNTRSTRPAATSARNTSPETASVGTLWRDAVEDPDQEQRREGLHRRDELVVGERRRRTGPPR